MSVIPSHGGQFYCRGIRVPEENYKPTGSELQTLSSKVVPCIHHYKQQSESQL